MLSGRLQLKMRTVQVSNSGSDLPGSLIRRNFCVFHLSSREKSSLETGNKIVHFTPHFVKTIPLIELWSLKCTSKIDYKFANVFSQKLFFQDKWSDSICPVLFQISATPVNVLCFSLEGLAFLLSSKQFDL